MSAVNSKPIIVFDLDGTLVETAPDLLDSLNHCLAISGLRTADSESLRRFVGQGGRVMIERAFAAQQKQVDDVKLDHLVEEFREHYAAHMPGHSTFYPAFLKRWIASARIVTPWLFAQTSLRLWPSNC